MAAPRALAKPHEVLLIDFDTVGDARRDAIWAGILDTPRADESQRVDVPNLPPVRNHALFTLWEHPSSLLDSDVEEKIKRWKSNKRNRTAPGDMFNLPIELTGPTERPSFPTFPLTRGNGEKKGRKPAKGADANPREEAAQPRKQVPRARKQLRRARPVIQSSDSSEPLDDDDSDSEGRTQRPPRTSKPNVLGWRDKKALVTSSPRPSTTLKTSDDDLHDISQPRDALFIDISDEEIATSPATTRKKAVRPITESRSLSPEIGMDVDRESPEVTFTIPEPEIEARIALLNEWNAIVSLHKAASLSITNEIDNQAIPSLPPNFEYLERDYVYDPKIPQEILPEQIHEFLLGCECEPGVDGECPCTAENECACCKTTQNDDLVTTYDNGIMVLIPDSAVGVIECNVNCRCNTSRSPTKGKGKARNNLGIDCGNRVAQLPRGIPLDIFKTENHGWGVRCFDHIPQGAVLGLYTGRLVQRDDPVNTGASGEYSFKLDMLIADDDAGYTVNAYTSGNWTRFVNHACRPSLVTVPVVYDTAQSEDAYVPKLAYVASRDIPPGEELTLDYGGSSRQARQSDDEGARGKQKRRGRPPKKTREGNVVCNCGPGERCRKITQWG